MDMLTEDDSDFENINAAVAIRTNWYTVPTMTVQKSIKMAALEGRQMRLQHCVS